MAKKQMVPKTDMREITRKMINDPNSWPNWPILPVKRYTLPRAGLSNLGVITEGKPTVYVTNMFDIPMAPEEWEALQKFEYPTFEAMMDDGWIVD